jgi:sulfur carrier protein
MSSGEEVLVNGQAHPLLASRTLAELISDLGHAPDGVATAINGEFVARSQRAERVLCDGDRVTCFQAITGG